MSRLPPSDTAATDLLEEGEFRRLLGRASARLLLALGIPLVILVGLALYLNDSAGWVDHTDLVIGQATRIDRLLLTMQTSFRAYRLSNDERFLEPLARARAELGPQLDTLAQLVADNPPQMTAAVALQGDARACETFLDREFADIRAGRTRVQDPRFLDHSAPLFSAAEAQVDAFTGVENHLRAERQARLHRVVATLFTGFGAAAFLGLPALAFWLQGLLREVTGSYRASRDEAHRRAGELQVTLSSIGDAVVATDREGRVDFLNPAAEQMMGWPSAEARGRPLSEVFPIFNEHTGAPAENPVGRVLRENIVVGLANHTVLRSRDGREWPIEDSAAPIRTAGGEILGVILVFHDVTLKRDSDRQVAEAAERFRLLADVVSLQVWTAGIDGKLDYANQECVEYFGANLERDILGNAWAQFVHPADLAAALRAWQQSLATGERYEVEFRLRRPDGAYRWFLVRAEAMRDAAGVVSKWFGTNTDIDDLKKAQAEAERASRAKDDFLAALSHELRTPLAPVLLTAAALRDDPTLPAEAREQLGMIERNIGLEARLIDDLLDLTAVSRGKLNLQLQSCDAHSLIGLAIDIVGRDAAAKGIVLERTLGARHSAVTADPARFQQIIWNLLRNAIKFTPAGGRVAIATSDQAGEAGAAWLRIEVSDSGIGIDPAALEQIFLPFEQGPAIGGQRFGGMGLGLAIARSIVELHGGRISAHSRGPNQGASFVIALPGAVPPPHGVTHAPATPPARPAAADSLRLLVVEDHAETLRALLHLLTRDGHRVVTAGSVAAGIAAAASDSFDLVISDLGLPDGTGNDLMRNLRDRFGLRGIALSGYGMQEDIARSREAGFIAHMVKPINFLELRQTLAQQARPPQG